MINKYYLDMPKVRKHIPCDKKFGIVMKEFYQGTLCSGSGQTVTQRNQAQAIAASETRKCKKK